MAVTVNQTGWRTRTDATAAQGGTPVWAGTQNTNAVIGPGVQFRVRFVLTNTGSTGDTGNKYNLGVSINGTSPVSSIIGIPDLSAADPTAGLSVDGQTLTTSLLTGTGTYSGTGKYCTGGNAALSSNIPAGDYIEMEYGIQFNSPYCDGNNYKFYIYRAGLGIEHYNSLPLFILPAVVYGTLAATEDGDAITAAGNVPHAATLNAQEVGDALTGHALATNRGTLIATEANDGLVGVAVGTDRGALAQTEANDTLVGAATGPATGILAQTEANDNLTGAAFAVLAGGLVGNLFVTEANDTLTGLGSVVGTVSSLIFVEADDALAGVGVRSPLEDSDTLAGFAGQPLSVILNAIEDSDIIVSSTLLGANQWIPAPPCDDTNWVPASGCN